MLETLTKMLVFLAACTYCVHNLGQFLSAPKKPHLDAAHRVLHYVKGTLGHGIFFPSSSSLRLKGFLDSASGAFLDTRCSVTAYCVFLGDSLISWKSKKQPTICWIRIPSHGQTFALSLLGCNPSYRIAHPKPAFVYCDNKAALHIATKLVFHGCIKQMESDCHLIREKLHQSFIQLFLVDSQHELADILTKLLGFDQMGKMGILNTYAPSWGGSWKLVILLHLSAVLSNYIDMLYFWLFFLLFCCSILILSCILYIAVHLIRIR